MYPEITYKSRTKVPPMLKKQPATGLPRLRNPSSKTGGGADAAIPMRRRKACYTPDEWDANHLLSSNRNLLLPPMPPSPSDKSEAQREQFEKSTLELFGLIDLDSNGVLSFPEIQR